MCVCVCVCELNLEMWRQLWRVMEISDILLLIDDIRHPVSTGQILGEGVGGGEGGVGGGGGGRGWGRGVCVN